MQTCVGSVAGMAFTGGFGSYLIAMDQQSYQNLGSIRGNLPSVRGPRLKTPHPPTYPCLAALHLLPARPNQPTALHPAAPFAPLVLPHSSRRSVRHKQKKCAQGKLRIALSPISEAAGSKGTCRDAAHLRALSCNRHPWLHARAGCV